MSVSVTPRPGGAGTGFFIAAAFAVAAQCGALWSGLVWDDLVFLERDLRIRDLSFVWRAFGDSFFGGLADNEMYRPVVNASLAIDWAISGSTPQDLNAGWFHFVNVVLHALNAGLVYIFLGLLTRRALGAPIIGAVLFAVHPLAAEPTAWIVGRCDLLAALFGLVSAILLLRSDSDRRLLAPAVVAYGLSLCAKASAASLPVVVALGLVAYQELPPGRLLGKRLLSRFALFALPAIVWLGARTAVLGSPFPEKGGLLWRDVSVLDGALGVGRALVLYAGHFLVPARLCGDYSGDAAWTLQDVGASGVIGLIGAAAVIGLGLWKLRRYPRLACPGLAILVTLIPVLQIVPIGAIVTDRFAYVPMIFACLLVGEGIERVFVSVSARTAVLLLVGVIVPLSVMSHLRARAWDDDVTFNQDVLAVTPAAREATQRLAVALDRRGGPGDHDRARSMLREAVDRWGDDDPAWELRTLGAFLIEDGELVEAETVLRRAVASARDRRRRAESRYNLAVALHRQGRDEEAVELLRKVIEHAPELDAPHRMLARLAGDAAGDAAGEKP